MDTKDLETQLQELLTARGDGWGDALMAWCQKVMVHLVEDESTERRFLSVWGAAVMKMALNGLLKRNEFIPPAFAQWLEENVVPLLFSVGTGECGSTVVMHPELTQLMIQCLLKTATVLNATPAPAASKVRTMTGSKRPPKKAKRAP